MPIAGMFKIATGAPGVVAASGATWLPSSFLSVWYCVRCARASWRPERPYRYPTNPSRKTPSNVRPLPTSWSVGRGFGGLAGLLAGGTGVAALPAGDASLAGSGGAVVTFEVSWITGSPLEPVACDGVAIRRVAEA